MSVSWCHRWKFTHPGSITIAIHRTTTGRVDVDGAYGLILDFYSPLTPIEVWEQKQDKIATFFGPGLRAQVSHKAGDKIELALIKNTQA